jgi:hypothetical protein
MNGLPVEEHYVGFEVITAFLLERTIFWDITPCSPSNVNQYLRRICRPEER